MTKYNIEIISQNEIKLYGFSKKSGDQTIPRDINELSENYSKIMGKEVLPYFVLSQNYDEEAKTFELFVGSIKVNESLEKFKIPQGKFAKITIKPKFKFLWGLSIGKAKRYFYTEWIKNSKYKSLNLEYEYHTEKSIGKNPTIDILFWIKDK